MGDGASLDAGLRLEDFAEQTGLELEDGSYETIAGYVIARLGRIPDVGDAVDVGADRLVVDEMAGRRVTRVALHRDVVAVPPAE